MRSFGSFWKCALLACVWFLHSTEGLQKVVVPSEYKEWAAEGPPQWVTDVEMQEKYGYSVFVYQKLDPDAANFFAYNRGTETGVYLKYIVDHYDSFPDVAIFVHAHPHDHQPNWLTMVDCISPKATYYNINYGKSPWFTRDPAFWVHTPLAIEQCWRDVLQITWDLEDDLSEFHRRLPPTEDIVVSTTCCNQFILSRTLVHKRPLHVWNKLLQILAMQDTCHVGEPEYETLFHFNHTTKRTKSGPEQPYYAIYQESKEHWPGKAVQGGAGEHLSHVIFGHQPLLMQHPDRTVYCQNFLKNCPGSPCK